MLVPFSNTTDDHPQEKNIPGLLNVILSLTTAHGHIAPHCDGFEGQQFERHQLALHVPLPAAQLRVCDSIYEFEEGELISFNVSLPHEVINPSNEARLVLLFDVMHEHLRSSPVRQQRAMSHLINNWKETVKFVDMMNKNGLTSAQVERTESTRKKKEESAFCTHEPTWQKTRQELDIFYRWVEENKGCCDCLPPGSPQLSDPHWIENEQKKQEARNFLN